MRYQDLEKISNFPQNITLLTDEEINNDCITITDFYNLPNGEKSKCTKGVICDNYIWVGRRTVKGTTHYFSSDNSDDGLVMYLTGTKDLLFKKVSNGKLKITNVKNNIGGINMAEIGKYNIAGEGEEIAGFDASSLAGKFQQIQEEVDNQIEKEETLVKEEENLQKPMNVDLDEAKKEMDEEISDEIKKLTPEELEKKKKQLKRQQEAEAREKFVNSIDDMNVASAPSLLISYNQKYSKFIGFIARTGSGIKCSIKDDYKRDANDELIIDTNKISVAKVEEYKAEGKAVPKKYCLKKKSIKFTNSAPQGFLGMALEMPFEGLVDFETFKKADGSSPVLDAETGKRTFVKLYKKDAGLAVILQLLGSAVKEHEETHPLLDGEEPSMLKVNLKVNEKARLRELALLKASNSEATLDDVPIMNSISLSFDRTPNRKRLRTERNTLPLRVYKTIKYTPDLTEEQASEINKVLFRPLLVPNTKGIKAIAKLEPEDRGLCTLLPDGRVISKFVEPNGGGIGIDVVSYETGQIISEPEIPLRLELKEGSKSKIAKFDFYDLLNAEDVEDEALSAKWSPLSVAKWKPFRDACRGEVTLEHLRGVGQVAKKGKSATAALDEERASKMFMASLTGAVLDGHHVKIIGVTDSLKEISKEVTQLNI